MVAGWTAAWLNWLFNGEIRQFIIAKFFPDRWIGGWSRLDILHMNNEELMMFLCTASGIPEFIRGVSTCPLCLSAYIAGFGALLSARAIYYTSGGLWELIPLVWALGAVIGFIAIKKHL